jgi:hypothetical protein
MELPSRWLACAHNPRNERFMSFARFAHAALHILNIAVRVGLSCGAGAEHNAQKFNIAACAACAHKRASVSVGP